jgi:hypothetical protein
VKSYELFFSKKIHNVFQVFYEGRSARNPILVKSKSKIWLELTRIGFGFDRIWLGSTRFDLNDSKRRFVSICSLTIMVSVSVNKNGYIREWVKSMHVCEYRGRKDILTYYYPEPHIMPSLHLSRIYTHIYTLAHIRTLRFCQVQVKSCQIQIQF